MSVQLTGRKYLTSYSGILKIIEEVLNSATFISAFTCGYDLKSHTIIFTTVYAFLSTAVFLLVYIKSWTRKILLPWHWMECLNCIGIVLIFMMISGVALSELTRPFIVTGVLGFITAMVYVLDLIDSYKLAITPRAQYVWTTPNIPI